MEKRFSQIYGYKAASKVFQFESMDDELRNSLWNALIIHYWDKIRWSGGITSGCFISKNENEQFYILCSMLWVDYFKTCLDTLSNNWNEVHKELKEYFYSCKWNEAYDFIEFIAKNYPKDDVNAKFKKLCNHYLKRENSGYRFIKSNITPITDKTEIAAIEEASKIEVGSVREHLSAALNKLSDRSNPDYRNSIKESILAVEAMTRKILDKDKGTLGDLLKEVEKRRKLHPALKEAFSKLYGYTGDEDGIRHALNIESSATYSLAKFMLVSCSSFINYLKETVDTN